MTNTDGVAIINRICPVCSNILVSYEQNKVPGGVMNTCYCSKCHSTFDFYFSQNGESITKKSSFQISDLDIALSIIVRIGGIDFIGHTKAYEITTAINGVSFMFKGCRQFNKVTITRQAEDIYQVWFCRVSKKFLTPCNHDTTDGVKGDDLKKLFSQKTEITIP